MKPHVQDILARYRLALLGLALVVVTAISFAPMQAEAAISVPVKQGNFTGTLNITGFTTQTVNGVQQLAAVGSLTGTLNGPNGALRSVAIGNLTIPAAVASASCEILHLVLGPVNLDLLGLQVTLSQITLDITAVSGPGNLLGNLLCAVADLLNNPPIPGLLQQLINLLNQILAAL